MSHRAYIAVPSSGDAGFDVYSSPNAGTDFKLYTILDDYDRSTLHRLQELPHQELEDVNNIKALAEEQDDIDFQTRGDEPIVSGSPLGTELQREDIFRNIDYLARDVLYLVSGGAVEVYFLSWTGVLLQSVLATAGQLEIYPKTNSPQKLAASDEQPFYRLSGNAFCRPEEAVQLRNDAPPIREVMDAFAEDHMAVCNNLPMLARHGTSQDVSCIGLATYTYKFTGSGKGAMLVQRTRQQGIAINATPERVSPELVFKDVRNRSNTIRWKHNQEWVDQLKIQDTVGVDGDVLAEMLARFNEKHEQQFSDINPASLEPPANRDLV